jgi:hypothetical protein
LICRLQHSTSRCSSAGIMNRDLIPDRRKICQLSKAFEIGYGSQPSLQFGGYLLLFRRVKLPMREADNLPISTAKNECSCSPPAVCFRGAYKDNFSLVYRNTVMEIRVSQIEGKFWTTCRRTLLQLDVNICYGLDGPRIESRWGRDFLHPSGQALGPTQPPIQRLPILSRGLNSRGVTLTTHLHLAPRLKKK